MGVWSSNWFWNLFCFEGLLCNNWKRISFAHSASQYHGGDLNKEWFVCTSPWFVHKIVHEDVQISLFCCQHNSNNTIMTGVIDRVQLYRIKCAKPTKWEKRPCFSFFTGQLLELCLFKWSSSNSTRTTAARLCRAQKMCLYETPKL